jgi:type 1 fimbriae regulatory protein FimB/type 1 fimbriae regulatory protein FimE
MSFEGCTTLGTTSRENGTVRNPPPKRRPNLEMRCREHLLPDEVEELIKAARQTRNGERDGCMILTAYRHGLRVGEIITLRWAQIDLRMGFMHVNRLKKGVASTHPISARESRALHVLKKNAKHTSPFVFVSERGVPFTDRGIRKIVFQAGLRAELDFPVHPHMLRHACGYYLALHGHDTRAIQAYLGHRSIEHTVRYTALAPDRFKNFWQD